MDGYDDRAAVAVTVGALALSAFSAGLVAGNGQTWAAAVVGGEVVVLGALAFDWLVCQIRLRYFLGKRAGARDALRWVKGDG